MSASAEISLLGYLNTPILVGDPDGNIVYANPSFCERFSASGEDPIGLPLAAVFGGGAREVVLKATAEVLQRGQAARLQIREGGFGYAGLASPIEAEDDRVGVVMVMLEEQSNEEYLTALTDEMADPIADALGALQTLSSSMGSEATKDQQTLIEKSLQDLESAKKWLAELQVAVRGGKPQQGRFDVAASIQRVAEHAQKDAEGRVDFEVLMSPNLPRVAGTPVVFERLLTQLLRERVHEAVDGHPVTLLARTLGGEQPRGVLVSVVDLPDPNRRISSGHPPEAVQHGMTSIGGESICVEDSVAGRVTSLRLAIASQ
ncbi:MAG: PAS domain-containing protein [Myxococcota bacterium]